MTTTPDAGGWFDPAQDEQLTAEQLRVLGHPIRLRIVRLLRAHGPDTASGLARRIGESSGVTSYHLRVLAEQGHIVDDPERGNGRDRWWRSARRYSSVSFGRPGDTADAEYTELAEQFFRVAAQAGLERLLGWIDSMSGRRAELAALPWGINDWWLEMTPTQATRFRDEVNALAHRYRVPGDDGSGSAGAPADGAQRVSFQFQLLPDDAAVGPATDTDTAADRS